MTEKFPLPDTNFTLLEDVFSFLFVRHPFLRAVSAYRMLRNNIVLNATQNKDGNKYPQVQQTWADREERDIIYPLGVRKLDLLAETAAAAQNTVPLSPEAYIYIGHSNALDSHYKALGLLEEAQ